MTAQEARALMPKNKFQEEYDIIMKDIAETASINMDFTYFQLSKEMLTKLKEDGYDVRYSVPNQEYRISW
jgi:TRAP-type mannitol/chloroaromatic compound transport system substrate-binding protein